VVEHAADEVARDVDDRAGVEVAREGPGRGVQGFTSRGKASRQASVPDVIEAAGRASRD